MAIREEFDGKYVVVFDELGLRAERYGEGWRDLTGDQLVLSMLQEVERLRAGKRADPSVRRARSKPVTLVVIAGSHEQASAFVAALPEPPRRWVYPATRGDLMGRDPARTRYVLVGSWAHSAAGVAAFDDCQRRGICPWAS